MDNFLKKISIPAWKYLQNEGIRSEIYHIISVDSTILQTIQCTDSSCHKSMQPPINPLGYLQGLFFKLPAYWYIENV